MTGGIATGKSYVVRRLREDGVPVIDADILAREAVVRGSPGLAAVVARFGADVLTGAGDLDRARLGELIFGDEIARRDLENIIHPVVRRRIAEFFESLPPETPLAVADIPLLYETHQERRFDKVIVVACPRETQIERVMVRDGLSRAQAERRVAAQLPIEEKARRADYVIHTDGTFAETDARVMATLAALRA